MKMYLYKFLASAFIAIFLNACKPSIDTPSVSPGEADFSSYIAVGNSLTAGYADGGLYLEGQKVAYPNLLAEKLKSVGGGTFASPLFDEDHANGSGYLYLKALVNGQPELGQVSDNLAYRDQEKHFIKYSESIQNLGIPGMRVDFAFSPLVSAGINYFERLLPDAEVGSTTYFDFIKDRDHTFFSLWLGSNDVLGYATAGGVGNEEKDKLTDKALFATLYRNLVGALTTNGEKGIVVTIPDVTRIPFFNTVKISAILRNVQQVNPGVEAIYIATKGGPRIATDADFVVLNFPADKIGKPNGLQIPYGLHPLNPIEDQYVLDQNEAEIAKEYADSYNDVIEAVASEKGLAIADVGPFFSKVQAGILINGATINASFIQGGAFSLDGVHLTPKGNALIANLLIDCINKQYQSTIPKIDVNKYRGVKIP